MTSTDPAVVKIPSFGFARGALVRHKTSGRNMLVIRGLGETTACIAIEGDAAGNVRLREYLTADLVQILGHDDQAADRIAEFEITFDSRWQADQRAIERWRAEKPGRDLTLPDRADLVVWLLDKLEDKEAALGDLAIPAPSSHGLRVSTDQIIDRLRIASKTLNGERMSDAERELRCLLENAAVRMIQLKGRYENAKRANARMRQRRREERAGGKIHAEWWSAMEDGELVYPDPGDALCEIEPGEIVGLIGVAEVDQMYGYRLGPVPGDEGGDDRGHFWFPTRIEAERALEAQLAADAASLPAPDAAP